MIHTSPQTTFTIAAQRVSREGDDRDVLPASLLVLHFANFLSSLISIHNGHLHIHEDEIIPILCREVNSLTPILRERNGGDFMLQRNAHHASVYRVVLHDKNLCLSEALASTTRTGLQLYFCHFHHIRPQMQLRNPHERHGKRNLNAPSSTPNAKPPQQSFLPIIEKGNIIDRFRYQLAAFEDDFHQQTLPPRRPEHERTHIKLLMRHKIVAQNAPKYLSDHLIDIGTVALNILGQRGIE